MVVVVSAMALVYAVSISNVMAALCLAIICGIGLVFYGAQANDEKDIDAK